MDEVARKHLINNPGPKVDSDEGQGGIKTNPTLFRTRSTPRRTHAFHYPLQSVARESQWEDELIAESPTLPPPIARASTSTRGSMTRVSKRLTM